MESRTIPKNIYFTPIAIMIAAVLIAVDLEQPEISAIVLIAGAVLAFWAVRVNLKNRDEKEGHTGAETKRAARSAKEGPLEKLRAETGMADELTMKLRSILEIGERLIHYDAENSPVVSEILKAYDGFVSDYLEGAADFAKKYRRAKAFIKTRDPGNLALEVRTLERRIADGEKGLEKMLSEKRATLHRLEEMVENQPVIRNGIETIQATLESLDTSIAEAEADPGRQNEIMDQIQLTLSSTATAIEKTLVAVSSNEQAIAGQ
ncbi:hypothetical protein SBDP1_580023 [Syntrophobacter sp. SbD1]|nr:hypothetical protein SBDP1_580023 [Syntrophobacter sp. SbD1]